MSVLSVDGGSGDSVGGGRGDVVPYLGIDKSIFQQWLLRDQPEQYEDTERREGNGQKGKE